MKTTMILKSGNPIVVSHVDQRTLSYIGKSKHKPQKPKGRKGRNATFFKRHGGHGGGAPLMEAVTRDHGRDQDARDGSHGSNRSDGLEQHGRLGCLPLVETDRNVNPGLDGSG